MMPFVRGEAPDFLSANQARWTEQWRRNRGKRAFDWPSLHGARINERLLVALKVLTDDHCAYCDNYPLGVEAKPCIDHRRPKSREEWAHLAFDWGNLYYVCAFCNHAKGEQWDEALLAPDEVGYDFWRYFDLDAMTGQLRPSPTAPPEDARRAERTIQILGLNGGMRPKMRAVVARASRADGEIRPYRFI
jgi:uncharacterized protein (TIGR02646 family)